MTEQEKEIQSIRSRNVTLQLSDADCRRLSELAGEHNITVSSLLESFIGDLVDGTYSNGSDERMYARQWFERCHFGMFPENTLLSHLISFGYDVDDFISTYEENEYFKAHPEEFVDEVSQLKDGEKLWFQADIEEYTEDWKPDYEPDMNKEIELCKKWLSDSNKLTANDISSTRRILESWNDAITVPEETKRLASTYADQGYDVDIISSNLFIIKLDNGKVDVYWQDGAFWEETHKEEQ